MLLSCFARLLCPCVGEHDGRLIQRISRRPPPPSTYPRLIFDYDHLLQMSTSSLDADADLCDLDITPVMSSPGIQQTSFPRFRDPVLIEQLGAQGRVPLPHASTNI